MAAQFVYENPALVDKLILIGSTHPRDISLAEEQCSCFEDLGSNDGVAAERVLDNKVKLPGHNKICPIGARTIRNLVITGFNSATMTPASAGAEQRR